MQDEDRPLIDREPAERPLQFVAVGEGTAGVRRRWPIHGQDPDVRGPMAGPLRFVVAGMDEDPVDPGLEAIRLPKLRQPAPGEDEGVLQRILGEGRVAQDPLGDRVERVTHLVHQGREGLPVTPAGLFDEISIHLRPSGRRDSWPRTTNYDGRVHTERSDPSREEATAAPKAYSRAMSERTDEDELRAVLTGEHPALLQFRRRLRRVPASPRCKLCAAPFAGPGGAVLRHFGFGRFAGNPAMCDKCIRRFSSHGIAGAEIPVTLLFADVRGSTGIAERMRPSEFRAFLDRFYRIGTGAIGTHDGLVDKFVGDEVIGLFFGGVTGPEHAAAGIAAAIDLMSRAGRKDATPMGPIPVGAAVDSGVAYVGGTGPEGTVDDFTALGDTVNVTARLASAAAAGELLVSLRAADAARRPIGDGERRSLDIRGRHEPVEVIALRP